MGGGIIVYLIIAIGIGCFLYQKFGYGHTDIMNEGREWISSAVNRILGRRNQSANGRQQPAADRRLVPAQRDNIIETGPMIYFANERHGRGDKEYRFNFKKAGNGWRAYILRTPSLRGRSDDSRVIHRLHDSDGYYICWDRQVDTLNDMQIISRRWADSIQEYISTGRFG